MRPVILSSPENTAFLLTIFCAGGSVTTSSPGCSVAGAGGARFRLALAGRQARQRIGAGRRGGDARRRRGHHRGGRGAARRGLRNDGGAGRRRQRLRLHWTGHRALPRQRPVRRRQQPALLRQVRHLLLVVEVRRAAHCPGGRGGGSEKMVPICACAGVATAINGAAISAARPAMPRVRNISAAQIDESRIAIFYSRDLNLSGRSRTSR